MPHRQLALGLHGGKLIHLLAVDAELPGGADVLYLQLSPWAFRDVFYSMLAAGFLVGAMVL